MTSEKRRLTRDELSSWQDFMQMQEILRSKLEQNLVARSNLSAADYTILAVLTRRRDPIRLSELGEVVGWEKSRLHHQLTRMCKRGLVERRSAPELGARAVEVTYTPEGRMAIADAAPDHIDDVRRWVVAPLTAAELTQLGEISRKIVAAIQS